MLAVILCSVFVGVVLTLIVQALFLKRWFSRLPVLGPSYKPQHERFSLPQDLADAIKDAELKSRKESCTCLNLIFQFLFKEIKDTRHVRGWVMRRMNAEFAEMLQTTTGKLLDQITVRDFNLGHTFPIIQNASIQSVVTKEDSHDIDELTLLLELVYHGGFQLAVDVDLVFGKSAYLSVKVTNLKGTARLQFTRFPYTHWSFSFIEDPVMDFEVESQFEGRPISQLTSLIINQIRRSVRKKHTLPNYKIRYKPFFIKPEPRPPAQDIYIHGNKLSAGSLVVNLVECSRLVRVSPESFIFCTLAIDSLPWNEMMSSRRKLWVSHDIEIIRGTPNSSIGITFREEFVHEKYEEMVIVESVAMGSPAALADIRRNDIVISVGTTKVTSSKQAAKLMKQGTDRLSLRVERSTPMKGLGHDFKFEEDTVSLRDTTDGGVTDQGGLRSDEEFDDYVNITITPIDQADKTSIKSQPLPSTSTASLAAEEKIPPASSPKKGFSILGSSSGLFLRKRGNRGEVGVSLPRGSPEMRSKEDHGARKELDDTSVGRRLGPGVPLQRRRSKSDVGLFTADKADVGSSGSETEPAPTQIPSQPITTADEVEEDSIDLRKTSFVKATQDPVFNEQFEFEVEDMHNFLNLCVWCKVPEKLDKQNRVVKPEKDILIGHVSIPLMDVALECLSTLQGDSRHTYKLTPAEVKAAASRGKVPNLAAHSGFDEKLCYGDITLAFHHTTAPLTNTERRRVEKIRAENDLNMEKQMHESRNNGLGRRRGPTSRRQTHWSVARTVNVHHVYDRPVEEGRHDFMGMHFQSATYCNFCHKKIWLKVAFQCRVCGMICHKKCTEKCQAQTKCSKNGLHSKPISGGPAPIPAYKEKDRENRDSRDSKDNTAQGQAQKVSFLSKFRKDQTQKLAPKEFKKEGTKSLASVMLDVPYVRRRRNSAPDREDSSESSEDVGGRGLLSVSSMPRTRSSTSLQDLLHDNAKPSLTPDEKTETDTSSIYSSDSDDEMNLLKFFEQQKSSQNADEVVVTAAKEMGKELYSYMPSEERRDKLDATVTKLQTEIDVESENRSELARMEREVTDAKQRGMIRSRIEKSDEKIQSLALLMLHYCAGLQHCLDQQEEERQRRANDPPQPPHPDDSQQMHLTLTNDDTAVKLHSPVAVGVEVTEAENGNTGSAGVSIRVPGQEDERPVEENLGESSKDSAPAEPELETPVATELTNQVNGQFGQEKGAKSEAALGISSSKTDVGDGIASTGRDTTGGHSMKGTQATNQ